MSMSLPMTVRRRLRAAFAVLLLAIVLDAGPVVAQQSAPGGPDVSEAPATPGFDQAQCIRETQRLARTLLEKIARAGGEAVRELEAASARVRGVLQDACAAAGVLASEEARAAAERMTEATRQAARTMRDELDGFYRSLPDEHKRRLDALGRLDLDGLLGELGGWFKDHVRRSENSPRDDGRGRPLGRICIADRCYDILGDSGWFSRWRERDEFRQE